MAQDSITYSDKTTGNTVTASEFNEIKTVVNNNASDAQSQLDDKADGTSVNKKVAFGDSGGALTTDVDFHYDSTTNRLGVGTNSPDGSLHVRSGSAGTATPSVSADDITIENSGSAGLSILTPNTNTASICFGDPENPFAGGFQYVHSTNEFRTVVNANEVMMIKSDGKIGIGTSSPSEILEVQSDTFDNAVFRRNADSEGVAISFANTNEATLGRVAGLSGDQLAFYHGTTEGMRIDSSGNVGIGTDSPVRPLHINSPTDTRLKLTTDATGLNDSDGFTLSVNNAGEVYFVNSESGAMVFSNNGSERARIDSSGNLLVGKTAINLNSVGAELRGTGQLSSTRTSGICGVFNRLSTVGDVVSYQYGGTEVGSVEIDSGSSVAYRTSSDYRLKENVTPLTGATERLKALKPSRFNWISDPDKTVDGFLAHEAQDVVPEAVNKTKDAMKTVEVPAELDEEGNVITPATTEEVPDYQQIDQSKLVPLLVATIQELEQRISDLEAV